ncbi:sigma 54-interacting transcriptional regulator [Pontibacterium sp. N1Y112]|uniref:Sigma 54-interacting transcriptional regulator n=1 Tax=Pontibacterium sinense TaxID=2781979 RepID=A0A8J7FG82_9GAMM|nr:sigma 54-interacting transcriptional regulator [Pontibacterium sinense]MBE9396803.1 sigma 54-interacting transcriptional regulator [Pontibacterium sinense]
MERTLVSWIGGHDLKCNDAEDADRGPLIATLSAQSYDCVELLYNYPEQEVEPYLRWLQQQTGKSINARRVDLSSPIHFGEIYQSAESLLAEVIGRDNEHQLHILLSPGTPAMQAVWILLGKTRYTATFWQSSREQGVEQAVIPFDISAEYVPAADKLSAATLSRLAAAEVPIDAAFDDIITHNPQMQTLKSQATVLAEREVPVLIYGESGTGKELFARAIHNASQRAGKPFIAVNCGAFPTDLVDSVLFGHKKGAFTGANVDKAGVFAQANGGTLFLDEFGELEASVQVRLLRVLQDGSFTSIGAESEQQVDVRIITATNRNLMLEVSEGRFREDLFYRVAVGVLHLPPLRERQGDISRLTDYLLAAIGQSDSHLKDKKVSVEGRNLILRQPWQGNIRELHSTLLRAALWSQSDVITRADIDQALFRMPERESDLLGQDVSQGIDVQALCDDVMRHYIPLALEVAQGKKKKAAELLGLNNYQTLSNYIEKLDIN